MYEFQGKTNIQSVARGMHRNLDSMVPITGSVKLQITNKWLLKNLHKL